MEGNERGSPAYMKIKLEGGERERSIFLKICFCFLTSISKKAPTVVATVEWYTREETGQILPRIGSAASAIN